MTRFYHTPSFVRKWYPDFHFNIESENTIYLTFDDGPHPEVTTWVLDLLDQYNAKATFFCVGKNLVDHSDIALATSNKGHQLGNHTQNHLNGRRANAQEYIQDVHECDMALNALKIDTNLFRPPYGRIKRSQIKGLANKKFIHWSHLSWDFDKNLTVKRSINRLRSASSGSILVFHDSVNAFSNLKKLLPELLAIYSDRGLKFETIS